MGRLYGLAYDIGQWLSYSILNPKAEMIICNTIQSLSEDDELNKDTETTKNQYNNVIHNKIDN